MVWGVSVISIVEVLATLWTTLGLSPITVSGRNNCKVAMQRRYWGLKVRVLYYLISGIPLYGSCPTFSSKVEPRGLAMGRHSRLTKPSIRMIEIRPLANVLNSQ